jgi:hypothetical protein
MRKPRFAIALVASAISAAVACGDAAAPRDDTDDGGNDAAPVDGNGGADVVADAPGETSVDAGADAIVDASVYPDGVTNIVVTEKGGYIAPGPDGSTCTPIDDTYGIALPTRELTWKCCRPTDAGPYELSTGTKTLSAAEYVPVDTALHALTLSNRKYCGADKPVGKITLTTPSGVVTFHDDFYTCVKQPGYTYVAGFDDVVAPLRQYAR